MLNRHSIRLSGYDYSQNGYYFITICTQNRESLFGQIVGAGFSRPRESSHPKMIINETGKIIENIWQSLPNRFPITLDAFQIMPNHVHFVLHIVVDGSDDIGRENPAPTITLGHIIAYFKYESTKQINQYGVRAGILPPDTIKKIFQRNYGVYPERSRRKHIIRNESEYLKIKKYIKQNPMMWERDRNNPGNIS